MKLFIGLVLLSILSPINASLAQDKVSKKVINLSISNSVPPYNMLGEKVDNHPGIQIEIVTKVLARLGLSAEWHTMTNNRAIHELEKGKLDGGLNISELLPSELYHTQSIVEFRNCLIGRQSEAQLFKDLSAFLEKLKSSPKLRASGFQGASKVFSEYLPKIKELPNYEEVPHQKSLAATLLMGRANYILSDFLVFRYYSQELKNSSKIKENPENFTCLYQIPSAPRAVSFKDQQLQINFDREFKKMIESGEKEKILSKYQLFLSRFLRNGGVWQLPSDRSIAHASAF